MVWFHQWSCDWSFSFGVWWCDGGAVRMLLVRLLKIRTQIQESVRHRNSTTIPQNQKSRKITSQ